VDRPWKLKFLGFSFYYRDQMIRIRGKYSVNTSKIF